MYKIRRTTNIELVEELHEECFGDKLELDGDQHWLVWQKGKDYPVGFASGRTSQTVVNWYFMTRAGVLPEARGQGLQKRLIRVRINYARKAGYDGIQTYAANWNTPSILSVLRSGMTIYDPQVKRGKKWPRKKRDGYIYFSKRFKH